MSFVEMVEMVDILKRAEYDGKYGLYPNPNVRKAKRRKELGHLKTPQTQLLMKKGKSPHTMKKDVEGEVHKVGEIVTTRGDVDVVEEETHFNSASPQILIGEIMVCNRDLEMVKKNITDVQKKKLPTSLMF
ncbi:hypothetical protein AB205_0031240 [Aquarana catesbeiana]|uniref:Uncharacterized protein n=2 Tax=Aquarana catesbeiana TaxID=8400 RepID=A0A2G9RX90_AQUCT|nr:hypothetical protein AB205_0031240 [Aquarana catesbeiana]